MALARGRAGLAGVLCATAPSGVVPARGARVVRAPARAALRAGDAVVAVAGAPLPGRSAAACAALARAAAGPRLELLVARRTRPSTPEPAARARTPELPAPGGPARGGGGGGDARALAAALRPLVAALDAADGGPRSSRGRAALVALGSPEGSARRAAYAARVERLWQLECAVARLVALLRAGAPVLPRGTAAADAGASVLADGAVASEAAGAPVFPGGTPVREGAGALAEVEDRITTFYL